MSAIHFVGGEKGGVGKSVFCRALAQYFIDGGEPFAAIDADNSHGAMLRFYAEYSHAADLSDVGSADQIMDRALGAERRVLVDLPAQSSRYLTRWFEEGDVLSLARETGVRIVLWHVSDGGYDSVQLLGKSLESFNDQIGYVLVRNEGTGKDFGTLDASEERKRLEHYGGSVVTLPALEVSTMNAIDFAGASFWAASHANGGAGALKAMQRQRAKSWLRRVYEQLSAAPT